MEAFFDNPYVYIQEKANICDIQPDFGLSEDIRQLLSSQPDIFVQNCPFIANNEDIEKFPPGQLVRIRFLIQQPEGKEYFNFRYTLSSDPNHFYTHFISSPDEEVEDDDQNKFQNVVHGERDTYTAISIEPSIQTPIFQLQYEIQAPLINISLTSEQKTNKSIPLKFLFKTSIPIKFQTGDVFDSIGIFEQPSNPLDNDFELDFETLPSFISFLTIPAPSLIRPIFIPFSLIPFSDVEMEREILLAFLQNFFDPIHSEIFLLWLLGRALAHHQTFCPGIISLNFYQSVPDHFIFFQKFLSSLSTTLISILPNSNPFSNKNFSIRAVSVGTRVLIGDFLESTEIFDEETIGMLDSLVISQTIFSDFSGYDYQLNVSLPILVISSEPTKINCGISIPLGDITMQDVNLESEISSKILRYIEEQRQMIVQWNQQSQEFMKNKLVDFMKDYIVSQTEANLLTTLVMLECVSHGVNEVNDIIYESALSIMKYILKEGL